MVSDLHVYDPTASAWTDLSFAAGAPQPRDAHGFVAIRHRLFVHGGYSGTSNEAGKLC